MLPLSDSENEAKRPPIFTIVFIIVNILMFGVSLTSQGGYENYITQHGTVPYRFLHHFGSQELMNCLSSMFLHGGLMHLIGNLWFLWIFGDNVEGELGHFNYVAFYILCGYFADLAHIASNPGSNVPTIGASGAISGVLASYVMLHPNAKIKTWIDGWWGTRDLPAWSFIGIWFAMQCAFGFLSPHASAGGTAWFAHIGGFVAGLALTPLLGAAAANSPDPTYKSNQYY